MEVMVLLNFKKIFHSISIEKISILDSCLIHKYIFINYGVESINYYEGYGPFSTFFFFFFFFSKRLFPIENGL